MMFAEADTACPPKKEHLPKGRGRARRVAKNGSRIGRGGNNNRSRNFNPNYQENTSNTSLHTVNPQYNNFNPPLYSMYNPNPNLLYNSNTQYKHNPHFYNYNPNPNPHYNNNYKTSAPNANTSNANANANSYNKNSHSDNFNANTYNASPYNANANNTNSHNDNLNFEELEAVLKLSFGEENSMIENLEKVINNALLSIKDSPDTTTHDFNASKLEEIMNLKTSNYVETDPQSSIGDESREVELKKEIILLRSVLEIKQLEHSQEMETLHNECNLLIQEFNFTAEGGTIKTLQNGLKDKEIKTTIQSLATELKKYKNEFEKKKEAELEKKFNAQLKAANNLLKTEKQKHLIQEGHVQKEVEAKVKAANLVHLAKLKKYESEKKLLEKELDDALNESRSLLDQVRILQNESKSKEKNLLILMEDAIRSNCECSICLSIFDKAVTTTCGHTFCKGCIDGWSNHLSTQVTCPNCRQLCTYRSIHFFDGLITKLKEKFPSIGKTTAGI